MNIKYWGAKQWITALSILTIVIVSIKIFRG